jgi:hypothetical protein
VTDTGRTGRFGYRDVRGGVAAALAVAAALGAFGCAHTGGASGSVREARVIWMRDATVYVVGRDSLPFEPGTPIVIREGGKPRASGQVRTIVDGGLAVVTLTSGSLDGVTKLERLEVATEGLSLRPPSLLRVGYPSSGRGASPVPCAHRVLPPPLLAYRTEVLAERAWRGVRDDTAASSSRPGDAPPAWPDTMLVRLFDDSADEEIALQRGEIDVAVFWPGEVSRYLRERWPDGENLEGAFAGTDSAGAAGLVCPIVARSHWVPYVRTMNHALASLLDCAPQGGAR